MNEFPVLLSISQNKIISNFSTTSKVIPWVNKSLGIAYLLSNIFVFLKQSCSQKFLGKLLILCIHDTLSNTSEVKSLPPNWPLHSTSAAFQLQLKSSVLNKFEFYCAQNILERRKSRELRCHSTFEGNAYFIYILPIQV